MRKHTATATQSASASKITYIITAITGTALKNPTGRVRKLLTSPERLAAHAAASPAAKDNAIDRIQRSRVQPIFR